MISYWYLISNTWHNSAPIRHVWLRNFNGIGFSGMSDISRSCKIKCDGVIGFPNILLIMLYSNIWPANYSPIRDIRLRNLSDLDFDLSMTLNVKCDGAIGLPVYGLLLMFHIALLGSVSRYKASKSE